MKRIDPSKLPSNHQTHWLTQRIAPSLPVFVGNYRPDMAIVEKLTHGCGTEDLSFGSKRDIRLVVKRLGETPHVALAMAPLLATSLA